MAGADAGQIEQPHCRALLGTCTPFLWRTQGREPQLACAYGILQGLPRWLGGLGCRAETGKSETSYTQGFITPWVQSSCEKHVYTIKRLLCQVCTLLWCVVILRIYRRSQGNNWEAKGFLFKNTEKGMCNSWQFNQVDWLEKIAITENSPELSFGDSCDLGWHQF